MALVFREHPLLLSFPSKHVLKPSVMVMKLAKPVSVLGMNDVPVKIHCIILMLAPENSSRGINEVLSYLSSLLVMDENSVDIFQYGDEQNITSYLTEKYIQFFREKLEDEEFIAL